MRKKYHKKTRSFFPIFLVVFGLTLFLLPSFFRIFSNFGFELYLRSRRELNPPAGGSILISRELINTSNVIGDYPKRIIIPSVKIDLPVEPAKVINGVWEIHDNVANFGVGSSLPKDSGNTVIFAHARWNLFLPLIKINKNDLISLETKDSHWFTYKVVDKKEVKPDQIEIIKPTNDRTLTLYTCTGFFDTRRLVVVAKEK